MTTLEQRTPAISTDMSRRPVETDDLCRFQLISDPRVSPDGRRVAVVITSLDKEADEYRAAVHLFPVEGGPSRQLTAGRKRDTAPRWSPDGQWLAFLSNRVGGKAQLFLAPTGGGEPFQVTDFAEGVAGPPVWSPDGARIALVAKVAPADPEAWAGKSAADRAALKARQPREIAALRYKFDGEGFREGRVRHIFVLPVNADQATLVGGADHPLPPITAGEADNTAPAWSPDGRQIAFVSGRDPRCEFVDLSDLWVVSAEGGEARQLTGTVGPVASPAWSPDGQTIAYVGHDTQPEWGPTTNDSVWLIPATGGTPRRLGGASDLSVGSGVIADMGAGDGDSGPVWAPGGRSLLFLAGEGGNVHLWRVDTAGGDAERLVSGDRAISSFSLDAAGGVLAFTAGTPTDPGQLLTAAADGTTERQLSDLNRTALAEIDLIAPERFTYPAEGGATIEGWTIRPRASAAQGATKTPLIVQIHGGPHGAYGNAAFFEFQLLAARGYAVLYTNPRGSTGYGQAFGSAQRLDWGGVDYRDVMAGLDHVLAQGWADPQRLGIAGGSYGGYLANWAIGQTTRFRAAASGRSTANRYSHWGNSDMGHRTGTWEFGGPPWQADRTAHYLERSPITYVERITTPLLLLNQEQDHRCPVEQAEQLFTALRSLGRPVEFVRFPNESHGMSRSGRISNRLYRLNRIVGWFDRWV